MLNIPFLLEQFNEKNSNNKCTHARTHTYIHAHTDINKNIDIVLNEK